MKTNNKTDKRRIWYAFALIKHVKGITPRMVASIIINLVFKMIPIFISLLTSYMISLFLVGELENAWTLFFWILITVILSGLFSYLNVLISHDMAYKILALLRDKAYRKIDEIAPASMIGKRSGELISIILEDVEILEWFYAHTIAQLITSIVIPFISLIILGSFSIYIPMILAPFLLGLIVVPAVNAKKSNMQGQSVRKEFAILNAQVIDGVQGLKDIISFQWYEPFFKRFFATSDSYHKKQLEYAIRSKNETRIFSLLINLGVLCSQAIIAILILYQKIDITLLIPLFILCSSVFTPLNDSLIMSTNYGLIFAAAKRLFNLMNEKPIVDDNGMRTENEVLEIGDNNIKIEFRNVAFSYPNKTDKKENIIKDISFSVCKGETVALVGASGSGKTTITRLLQRFFDVDRGKITINDINIKDIALNELRKLVTVVPQQVYLFNMSIADNLKLANKKVSKADIINAAKKAQADDFIKKFPKEYDTVVGERGLRLSGGEKQRIAITQAILKDAPILVLDESSANLDSETEKQINLAIKSLKAGRATLIVAHRVSTIKSADKIIVIKDGLVEKIGKYDQLIDECEYFVKLTGGEEYE